MNADVELESWRQQWHTNAVIPIDLQAKVRHETRYRRMFLMVKLGITAIFGGTAIVWTLVSAQKDTAVLALGIWAFIAINWAFSWLNDRGTREPVMATTLGFLDVSIARCRSAVRRIAFASVAYAVWVAFVVWVELDVSHGGSSLASLLTSPWLVAIYGVTVCLGVLAVWRRQILRRELRNLMDLRREMDDQA